MIVRSSLPQNVVVRHEISDSYIAKLFSFAQNVSSTRSSLKSVGRRFNPSYRSTRCLPSSATNKLRCESRIDQSTLCRFTSSTRAPALASQVARMRQLGLITLPWQAATLSRLSGADCNGDGDRNERSHNTSEKSVQNCAFQSPNFEADPKIGSSVGRSWPGTARLFPMVPACSMGLTIRHDRRDR